MPWLHIWVAVAPRDASECIVALTVRRCRGHHWRGRIWQFFAVISVPSAIVDTIPHGIINRDIYNNADELGECVVLQFVGLARTESVLSITATRSPCMDALPVQTTTTVSATISATVTSVSQHCHCIGNDSTHILRRPHV